MKTIIKRTSTWNSKPCDEAVLENLTPLNYRTVVTLEGAKTEPWYDDWFNSGDNHREEGGMIVCDSKIKEDIWTIEFDV